MTRWVQELPLPPSLNAYYLNAKRRVKQGPKAGKSYTGRMISPEGLAYRGEVMRVVRAGHRLPPRISGRLNVVVFAQPPVDMKDGHGGRRANMNRRDLDNLWKCLLDALTKAEVVLDDSLYDDVRMVRGNRLGRGSVWVSIAPFDPRGAFAAVRDAGIPLPAGDLVELA